MIKNTKKKLYLKVIIKLYYLYYLTDLKISRINMFHFVVCVIDLMIQEIIINYKVISYDLENINTYYDNCVIKYKLYLKYNPFARQNSF